MYNNIIFREEKNGHLYTTYKLTYSENKEKFIQYILPVLEEEYGLGKSFDEKTSSLSSDRKEIMRKLMQKYNTPDPTVNPLNSKNRTQLKPSRSKIAEVIAKDYLQKDLNVSFAGRISLEEDDPDLPRRGVDNFGFIFTEVNGDIRLTKMVICEVKASDAKKNPPDVVSKNQDSLYNSLLELSKGDKRLKKALVKSFDRFNVEKLTALIAELAIDIEQNSELKQIREKMLIVPFLLRTENEYKQKDFEKFYEDPSEFNGTVINFYIMLVDVPLDEFATDIYSRLRGENYE